MTREYISSLKTYISIYKYFVFNGCVVISAFASLVSVPVDITSSALKSISQLSRKRKKHDKIVLLAITRSNTIDALISKTLIDSCINYN